MLSNIIGGLLISVILGCLLKASNISHFTSLFLATGFCGGFTTFTNFIYKNHLFLKNGDYFSFLSYTLGTFILDFIAIFLGLYISKIL